MKAPAFSSSAPGGAEEVAIGNTGELLRSYVGCRMRVNANQRSILSKMHAASEIHSRRLNEQPLPETAHLILSLKHPDEVTALRRISSPLALSIPQLPCPDRHDRSRHA